MTDTGKRVGVLVGGPSNEREISIKTGKAVYQALKADGCPVELIDIPVNVTPSSAKKLLSATGIDIAFIALHGAFGEDGQLQEILEEMKLPFTGSGSIASQQAMDKIISRDIFHAIGLKISPGVVIEEPDTFDIAKIKFPVVVKPHNQGSSIGLSIIEDKKDLPSAISAAFELSGQVILEEYIPGRELTVGILAEEALPVVEIIPAKKFYDFEAKYDHPGTRYEVPAQISIEVCQEAQQAAFLAHQALGLEVFSRIDMILGVDKGLYVLEANSIPGLTERSLLPKAALERGINFTKLCNLIITESFKKYGLILR